MGDLHTKEVQKYVESMAQRRGMKLLELWQN